ncbi:MAG: cytochrome c [Chloroflexi bacterium]|nr:cytochrome c [Chloroflexota bacterium]MYF65552.1 cytochrome c [Chloroflexota bacterium]MYK34655.1 cytochrome c [Chloroflexota bacterium]
MTKVAHARAAPLALLLLALVLLTSCTSSPYDPAVVSRGKDVFAATCATCHGAGGEGQANWHIAKDDGTLPPPPLNGDGHTWHHGDGLLYRIVRNGGQEFEDPRFSSFKSAMPAFGEQLSHDDIVAVITYLKSLWGDKTSRGISIVESQARASEDDPFPPSGG